MSAVFFGPKGMIDESGGHRNDNDPAFTDRVTAGVGQAATFSDQTDILPSSASSTQAHTIVRNSAALMASQLITWALALVLVIFLPRYLGPVAFGQLQLAVSVLAIVSTVAGFGSEVMMVKEIARHPKNAAELVLTVIILRWLFFAGGCVAVGIYLLLADESTVLFSLFVILGAAQPFLLAGGAFQAALQGQERMQSIAVAMVISKTIYTLLALLAVVAGMSVHYVAVAMVVGDIAYLTVLAVCLISNVRSGWRFRPELVKRLIVSSAPFLALALVLIGYRETSVLVVAAISNFEAVGWFTVARTLAATLMFIPTIFATALLPAASRGHIEGAEVLTTLASRSIKLMLVCGVPISLGVAVVADPVVNLFYGEQFSPSGLVLSVFGLSLVATYQSILLGSLLAASDRQAIWTSIMAFALPVKVLLDIALVWSCDRFLANGAAGAAISIALSECMIVFIGMRLLPKGTFKRADGWFASRIVLAGSFMAGVAWLLRSDAVFPSVIAGAVVYIGLIAAMRVMPPEDIILLKSMILGLFARIGFRRAGAPGR